MNSPQRFWPKMINIIIFTVVILKMQFINIHLLKYISHFAKKYLQRRCNEKRVLFTANIHMIVKLKNIDYRKRKNRAEKPSSRVQALKPGFCFGKTSNIIALL
jgi:hypothetical protein